MSVEQDYIDNVLFEVQCCLANIVSQIADQDYIGVDCVDKREDAELLKAIITALKNNRPELSDNPPELIEKCLDTEEINTLISKAKTICGNCCIPNLD